MGIKDLRRFLKSKDVNCFFNLPLQQLKHTKMGIDTFNWIFTYLNPVIKRYLDGMTNILDPIDEEVLFEELCDEFLKFNCLLLKHDITPVWVWDGVAKSCKSKTQDKRRELKNKMIEEKKLIYNVLINMPLLERNGSDLLDKYRKLVINTQYLPKKYFGKLKELSQKIGLPTITARDEAEALASSLAIEGKIKSIWSSDTDTYAFGAPLIVKQFIHEDGTLKIESVYTPNIRESLEMDYHQFRDFCILLGTDFNDRIYKMGPVNSFKLIKKYGNLETMEREHTSDLTSLNYRYVRLQLTPYSTEAVETDLVMKPIVVALDDAVKQTLDYDFDTLSYNDKMYVLKELATKDKLPGYEFMKFKRIDEFLTNSLKFLK